MPKKKVVKKTKTVKTKKAAAPKPVRFRDRYGKERDDFLAQRPMVKYLLGILIVAFTLYVAHMYYVKQLQIQIGNTLATQGIPYTP